MEKDFIIRPIVNCLPAWFRFAQCLRRYRDSKEAFPHLVNAGKYSATFFTVIFATLRAYHSGEWRGNRVRAIVTSDCRPNRACFCCLFVSFGAADYANTFDNPYTILWILSSMVSSCYAYTWDIRMDWGLLDANAGDNRFLREEMVYSSVSRWILGANWSVLNSTFYHSIRAQRFYYFGIVEDLILRFGWTLSMSLVEAGVAGSEVMITVLSPLEVFRRFMWNYFRLENEHLNNCGKFRAVRDISVAPMDCSDQVSVPNRDTQLQTGALHSDCTDDRSANDGRRRGRREPASAQPNSNEKEARRSSVAAR